MQQNLITKINGVDIITVDYQGETYVPVKPICDALGISLERQREKIQSDDILSTTAALRGGSCRRRQGARDALSAPPLRIWLALHHQP